MKKIGIYIKDIYNADVSDNLINDFKSRVQTDGGTYEADTCLFNYLGTIGGTIITYNRVELFDDEKISITSSIQNINDIAKTYTDFSQTFTVPATKQNNKIFKHWYDNSNDDPFSTLVKSDAYIEIDTIPFRKGKIQLESANIVDGRPQDYSITFIGTLGNLKDTFNGLYLKDLTDQTYDFAYSATEVKDRVTQYNDSQNVMFPLISSNNYWRYGSGDYRIDQNNYPIYYNDLFPAIRISRILNMIERQFKIDFSGTFINGGKFENAYLYLKNSDEFIEKYTYEVLKFQTQTGFPPSGTYAQYQWQNYNTTTNTFTSANQNTTSWIMDAFLEYRTSGSGFFNVELWDVNNNILIKKITGGIISPTITQSISLFNDFGGITYLNKFKNITFEIRITSFGTITFLNTYTRIKLKWESSNGFFSGFQYLNTTSNQLINNSKLTIKQYMPEIKIEDFFSGILKMFNLTCYSTDGINYTVEQLESYYSVGSDIDITKYIIQDKKTLNRVKAYKKINFEYEKSESLVNVAFNSANGIEYGSLYYTLQAEGEEYSIKLPFEDLNFTNLIGTLQVGYCLKPDTITKYIPKPIILYDYNPIALTSTGGHTFHFATSSSGGGGVGTAYTSYKAFGQEYLDTSVTPNVTYGLNFPTQQSTLTNEVVNNGLYNQYYENYFSNIFNVKARLIKVSAILPTSILTTLKLNDNVLIRDTKYLINTMTTDLTTGEVQFELLTDQRQ